MEKHFHLNHSQSFIRIAVHYGLSQPTTFTTCYRGAPKFAELVKPQLKNYDIHSQLNRERDWIMVSLYR